LNVSGLRAGEQKQITAGVKHPGLFIVWDEKAAFFVLSSPRIGHPAAGGAGSLS
jgi:hypothetical protein